MIQSDSFRANFGTDPLLMGTPTAVLVAKCYHWFEGAKLELWDRDLRLFMDPADAMRSLLVAQELLQQLYVPLRLMGYHPPEVDARVDPVGYLNLNADFLTACVSLIVDTAPDMRAN